MFQFRFQFVLPFAFGFLAIRLIDQRDPLILGQPHLKMVNTFVVVQKKDLFLRFVFTTTKVATALL